MNVTEVITGVIWKVSIDFLGRGQFQRHFDNRESANAYISEKLTDRPHEAVKIELTFIELD